MTIELKSAQEKIILEQLATGRYGSVEELLDTALSNLLNCVYVQYRGLGRNRSSGKTSLAELFAVSPFKGLDLDFERDRDTGRSIDL